VGEARGRCERSRRSDAGADLFPSIARALKFTVRGQTTSDSQIDTVKHLAEEARHEHSTDPWFYQFYHLLCCRIKERGREGRMVRSELQFFVFVRRR